MRRPTLDRYVWARRDLNPHIRAFSPILCLSTQVGEESPSWGFHAAMVTGAARLVSSSYVGAVGVRAASGAPASDGRPPGYGVWLTALRVSSLWSANSAQTITMIAMVTMPVTADTTPCMPVMARLNGKRRVLAACLSAHRAVINGSALYATMAITECD